MELRHEFTVSTGVQEAWDHFGDIASVATCFPGAQVTSVEGETFSGQVKVKLGPIALVYTGQGEFVEKDEAAHRFVVDAKGRDKRGNGTAGAKVMLTMTEQGPDSTSVEVLTDLAVTGKPAQFGRGVMQDVSDKLLGQFTQCLERQLQSGGTPAAGSADADAGAATATSSAGTTPAADAVGSTGPAGSAGANGGAAGSGGLLAAAGAPSVGASESSGNGSGPLLAAASASSAGSADSGPIAAPAPPPADDVPGDAAALDLGATVLPVLAKAYWKQALGAVLALLVLRRLFGGSKD